MKKICPKCKHEFEVGNEKDIVFINDIFKEFVEIQIDCPKCSGSVAFARVKADDFIYLNW